MPRGDGSGPAGAGPMTGRAAGFCAGFNMPGYANPMPCGRGMGFGRGFRRGFAPMQTVPVARSVQMNKTDEKAVLEDELKVIENESKIIKERLKELSKK